MSDISSTHGSLEKPSDYRLTPPLYPTITRPDRVGHFTKDDAELALGVLRPTITGLFLLANLADLVELRVLNGSLSAIAQSDPSGRRVTALQDFIGDITTTFALRASYGDTYTSFGASRNDLVTLGYTVRDLIDLFPDALRTLLNIDVLSDVDRSLGHYFAKRKEDISLLYPPSEVTDGQLELFPHHALICPAWKVEMVTASKSLPREDRIFLNTAQLLIDMLCIVVIESDYDTYARRDEILEDIRVSYAAHCSDVSEYLTRHQNCSTMLSQQAPAIAILKTLQDLERLERVVQERYKEDVSNSNEPIVLAVVEASFLDRALVAPDVYPKSWTRLLYSKEKRCLMFDQRRTNQKGQEVGNTSAFRIFPDLARLNNSCELLQATEVFAALDVDAIIRSLPER